MDYFNSLLPVEITLDILTRLPTESVLDSKLVCTRWRNIVSKHPSFSKMHFHRHQHLNHRSSDAAQDCSCKLGFLALTFYDSAIDLKFHYFEYNEEEELTTPIQRIKRVNFASPLTNPEIIGSQNGLICFVQHHKPVFCICNPITREYVLLPKINSDCCENYQSWYWTCGFGYVSSTNDYKMLVMFMVETNVEVHIYTLGSGKGWRNLGNFDFGIDKCDWVWGETGIFANEILYWMTNNKLQTIVTFDLAEEKFCEHLSPPLPPGMFLHHHRNGVLNGFLFYAAYLDDGERRFYDIWLLKKKNDNHGKDEGEENQSLGWSKEFSIEWFKLLAITKSDGVLTHDGNYYINIYNRKTSTLRRLVKFKDSIWQTLPHENTFVSLRELGEENIKVTESIEIEDTKSRQEDADPEYIYL